MNRHTRRFETITGTASADARPPGKVFISAIRFAATSSSPVVHTTSPTAGDVVLATYLQAVLPLPLEVTGRQSVAEVALEQLELVRVALQPLVRQCGNRRLRDRGIRVSARGM